MKKRFLSVIIALSMIVACAAMPAGAAKDFPDVLSPDHDWAADQIREMTDIGIIKGYTDGTFKPDKAINKIEALLLFSRVAGYSNVNNTACIDFAYNKYQYILGDLDLDAYDSYKKEIAFLLYKGVMGDDEILEYLNEKKYLDEFPRADAAMLLANLMDAEIRNTESSTLDFADAAEIPSSLAGYISYVVDSGLMNGVKKDDGTVVFDAKAPLSRAQVCVLLYRILEKLDMSVEEGSVTSVNTDGGVIEFITENGENNSYIVPSNVKIRVDGAEAELSKVLNESKIVFVRHGKSIYSIDVFNPKSNATVKGVVEAFSLNKAYIKLSVKPDGADKAVTYYSQDTFDVTTDGVSDKVSSIARGDYVVVKLLGNDIVSIDRQTAEATVQGVISGIKFSSPITLTVVTVDELSKKETVFDYTVSDSAVVRRDGVKATLREIVSGDKVVLTITRGDISKIVATSTPGSVTGTITAIKIAAQSTLTISVNGTEKEYPVSIDASYVVGGAQASIYELRLGNLVTLTLSGSTVKKVEQTSASSASTKAGVVKNVNTAYGYLDILTAESVNEQIFVSKSASTVTTKIIDGETGREILLKNLKEGDNIIATGAYSNGAFVAKTIVVTPSAK